MEIKITEGFSIGWERNLGHAVDRLREEDGIPMKDICKRVDMPNVLYPEFVNARRSITVYTLMKLLNVLNVDMILRRRDDDDDQ